MVSSRPRNRKHEWPSQVSSIPHLGRPAASRAAGTAIIVAWGHVGSPPRRRPVAIQSWGGPSGRAIIRARGAAGAPRQGTNAARGADRRSGPATPRTGRRATAVTTAPAPHTPHTASAPSATGTPAAGAAVLARPRAWAQQGGAVPDDAWQRRDTTYFTIYYTAAGADAMERYASGRGWPVRVRGRRLRPRPHRAGPPPPLPHYAGLRGGQPDRPLRGGRGSARRHARGRDRYCRRSGGPRGRADAARYRAPRADAPRAHRVIGRPAAHRLPGRARPVRREGGERTGVGWRRVCAPPTDRGSC